MTTRKRRESEGEKSKIQATSTTSHSHSDRDRELLQHLGDPVLVSLYTNMLDVEAKFKGLVSQMTQFVRSVRNMCGVTEVVSRLIFEGCGADEGDLGLNVRKYRSTVQTIAHRHCGQLEENLQITVTEPLKFQLESFDMHRNQVAAYIEQNKIYTALRKKVGRARSGSTSRKKLKSQFETLGAKRRTLNERLLTDLSTLYENRHDIISAPFRHFQRVQCEFMKEFTEMLEESAIKGVGKTPKIKVVRVPSLTRKTSRDAGSGGGGGDGGSRRAEDNRRRVPTSASKRKVPPPMPVQQEAAPVVPMAARSSGSRRRERGGETNEATDGKTGTSSTKLPTKTTTVTTATTGVPEVPDDIPEPDKTSSQGEGTRLVMRNGKWVLVRRVKKKKKTKTKKKKKKKKKKKGEASLQDVTTATAGDVGVTTRSTTSDAGREAKEDVDDSNKNAATTSSSTPAPTARNDTTEAARTTVTNIKKTEMESSIERCAGKVSEEGMTLQPTSDKATVVAKAASPIPDKEEKKEEDDDDDDEWQTDFTTAPTVPSDGASAGIVENVEEIEWC
eukprot:g2817.t1